LQIVILIDFAYQWQEDWMSEQKEWKAGIMGVTGLFYAGSLVLVIFYFRWFGGTGCDLENFFIAWTMINAAVYSILSISPLGRHGILPSAVVCLYCHYILYSSLARFVI